MAKYDSLRKLERNKLLYEYAQNHPELSCAQIGKPFDVSGQRAWIIIKKEKARLKAMESYLSVA